MMPRRAKWTPFQSNFLDAVLSQNTGISLPLRDSQRHLRWVAHFMDGRESSMRKSPTTEVADARAWGQVPIAGAIYPYGGEKKGLIELIAGDGQIYAIQSTVGTQGLMQRDFDVRVYPLSAQPVTVDLFVRGQRVDLMVGGGVENQELLNWRLRKIAQIPTVVVPEISRDCRLVTMEVYGCLCPRMVLPDGNVFVIAGTDTWEVAVGIPEDDSADVKWVAIDQVNEERVVCSSAQEAVNACSHFLNQSFIGGA